MYVNVLVVLLTDELQLRVKLEHDDARKFEAIRKKYGLTQNTETFRLILTNFYEQIMKKSVEVPA